MEESSVSQAALTDNVVHKLLRTSLKLVQSVIFHYSYGKAIALLLRNLLPIVPLCLCPLFLCVNTVLLFERFGFGFGVYVFGVSKDKLSNLVLQNWTSQALCSPWEKLFLRPSHQHCEVLKSQVQRLNIKIVSSNVFCCIAISFLAFSLWEAFGISSLASQVHSSVILPSCLGVLDDSVVKMFLYY